MKLLAASILALGISAQAQAQNNWHVVTIQRQAPAGDTRAQPARPPRFEEIFRRGIFGRRWLPEPSRDGYRPPVAPQVNTATRGGHTAPVQRDNRPPRRPK